MSAKNTSKSHQGDRSERKARRSTRERQLRAPERTSSVNIAVGDSETPPDLLAKLKQELSERDNRIEDLSSERKKWKSILEDMSATLEEVNTSIEDYGTACDALGARRSDLNTYFQTKSKTIGSVAKDIIPLYEKALDEYSENLGALEQSVEEADSELQQAKTADTQTREELAGIVKELNSVKDINAETQRQLESMEVIRTEIQELENESTPDIPRIYVLLTDLEEILNSTTVAPLNKYTDQINNAWKALYGARTNALDIQQKLSLSQENLDKAQAARDAFRNNRQGFILQKINSLLKKTAQRKIA